MDPLVTAAAVEAVWLTAYAVIALATWPRRPRRPAADPALSPSVQVLLARRAKGWVPAAVDATFAGLVRRGWIEPWAGQLRLGPGDGEPFTPAEREIFDHLSKVVSRSSDGTAPVTALNEGQSAAEEWKSFQRATEREASDRGLIRPRVSKATRMLLSIAGMIAPLTYSFAAKTGDGLTTGIMLSIAFGGLLHGGLVAYTLGGQVLTRAGALAAGPVAAAGSPLTALRDDSSGQTYDETLGRWRQWHVQRDKVIRFSPWPRMVVLIAALIWTIALLTAISGYDGLRWLKQTSMVFGFYVAAIALWGGIGIYRSWVLRQGRLAFERSRQPVVGTAVRKRMHTYSVSSGDGGNTTVTDHYVVIDPGNGLPVREFIVPETDYDTVQEGQSWVRGLARWQSAHAASFEVLSS